MKIKVLYAIAGCVLLPKEKTVEVSSTDNQTILSALAASGETNVTHILSTEEVAENED